MKIPRCLRHSVFYLYLHDSLLGKKYLKRKGRVIHYAEINNYLNQAPVVILKEKIEKKIKVGIVKDGFGFDEYVQKNASWLKYERFCKENQIAYEYYDIYASDWIEAAVELDLIVWHTASTPSAMYIAESKIYVLEKLMGKQCFPSFHEVWQYEDKSRAAYLYKLYDLPCIPTITTNRKEEAVGILRELEYPLIFKTHIGAGSSGVVKVDRIEKALKIANSVFSLFGKKTVFPNQRQKDYLIIQQFISDATFDLRIMIVGDKAFGYYRYPDKYDYRASGSGHYEKKAIPQDALNIAVDVKNLLNSRLMGIDLLYSEKDKQYYIIEASLFNQLDTPKQLMIDGIPGYYDLSSIPYSFKEGMYWLEELLMEELFKNIK